MQRIEGFRGDQLIPGAVEHLERLLRDTEGLSGPEAQRMAAGWARTLVEANRIPDGTVDLAYFDRSRRRRRFFQLHSGRM